MNITRDIYASALPLLTDLYQLTMANGYYKSGKSEQEGVFNLFFRKHPFDGGFTLICGLEYVMDFLSSFRFSESDITYLRGLKGNDDQPLFGEDFLDYLLNLELSIEVDAMPEGTVAFPHEPIIRVRGPLAQCQLIETALLNIINFQTLIATKAARMNIAARGEPVLEFGLRRAQGIDGALAASRAAYIGGCTSTSNVLAGKLFGIPVAGTHAHSWVMSFDSELEAFKTYAEVMPNNCVLLVDTYDTIEGVKHAIEVGKILKSRGRKLAGVRIDSGDLAYFSLQARQLLDEAGFQETRIVASNDLDEYIISSLKEQDAKVQVWGIGTKLVTAYDQPALGAVYKLSAIRQDEEWKYKVKLSEQAIKVNNPGIQQVRRFRENGQFVADMIWDELLGISEKVRIVDPGDATRQKKIDAGTEYEDLLIPIFRAGKKVYDSPGIDEVRQRAMDQIEMLDKSVKRFVNPHSYPAGLERRLHTKKTDLIMQLRKLV